jgi:hypothetical protein
MATKQAPTGIDERGTPRGARRLRSGVSGGIAVLGSGVAAVTVLNAYVQADDHFTLTPAPASFGAIGSNQGVICVRSINPGVGFVIGNTTAAAYPWDTNVHWMIHKL